MKRLAIFLVSAAWVAGCSDTPTVIPTKNMDRPTDMAFVCLGMLTPDDGGQAVLSGLPMQACHQRGKKDPPISADGQRTLGTFAFVANAGRGELAVADMDRGRLLDLAPAAPGYGMLTIGGDPESMASTQDGCWVATANRGTCDFTMVDPSQLVAASFAQGSTQVSLATGSGDAAHRLSVQTPSGRKIHSATGEIAFLPSNGAPVACAPDAVNTAVVTFPGCDMVAVLDFSFKDSSATIRSAFYVRSGVVQAAGDEPVCPADCAATEAQDAGTAPADLDAGVTSDGGGAVNAGMRPVGRLQPLALVPDGSRVYVGSLSDPTITSFDIAQGDLGDPSRRLLANPTGLVLAEDAVGVSRLRLNVDPYLPTVLSDGSSIQGQFLVGRGMRFLYAFASDDSVRVINVNGAVPVECDVNVLPTFLTAKNQPCVPLDPAHRRALVRGPGLHIPTFASPDNPPPLPRDIAFADLQPPPGDGNLHALSGQFGFLLASNGQTYVVNLAPNGADQTVTHSFRDLRDVGEATRTPLAVSIAPQRAMVVSDQAFASAASFSATDGPLIPEFLAPDESGATTTTWFGLPDPDNVISRAWDVVWEGALPQASRESGIVQPVQAVASSAGGLNDSGADFCSSGVQVGDVLQFAGCVRDADCQPDDQFSCQVTVSGGRGVCLWRDGARTLALTSRKDCSRFMGSRMRYDIAQATPTTLALNLKLDEVPKTSLNPCETDAHCRPDAEHGKLSVDKSDDDNLAHAFECLQLSPSSDKRCVERCRLGHDSDCRAGNVCESVPGVLGQAEGTGLCVQAPRIVDTTCFPQPMTRYGVRAGNSYVVYGSSLPRLRTTKGAAGQSCSLDKTANPELVNRIPLSAPQCPTDFLDRAPSGGAQLVQQLSAFSLPAGSNPCLYTGTSFDGVTVAADSVRQPVRAFFENSQIRFVLANLDQYAGDLLSIHFEFQYGFVPLTVQIPNYEILLTMPTRILTGPTMTPESPIRRNAADEITYPYLYVVDQGHTPLTLTSRGQVVRINARAGSNEVATFDTALSGSTPFQLQ